MAFLTITCDIFAVGLLVVLYFLPKDAVVTHLGDLAKYFYAVFLLATISAVVLNLWAWVIRPPKHKPY